MLDNSFIGRYFGDRYTDAFVIAVLLSAVIVGAVLVLVLAIQSI